MKINQYGTTTVVAVPSRNEDRRSSNVKGDGAGATVSISSEARNLGEAQQKLTAQPDIREAKILAAKLALSDGSLDTDEALDAAIDRLIADLA